MARVKKPKTIGPKFEDGIKYEVVPATKKALSKLKEGFKGDSALIENMVLLTSFDYIGLDAGKAAIEERASSWSGKYCPFVTIRDLNAIKHPKVKELKDRVSKDEAALKDAIAKADVSAFKAKFITCGGCESKVNKDYIKESKCPVCGHSMISPTAHVSIERKRVRLKKDKMALANELKRRSGEAPLRYLVAMPKVRSARKKSLDGNV